MALHRKPALALVIGLGGGVTPGAVSQHQADVDLIERRRPWSRAPRGSLTSTTTCSGGRTSGWRIDDGGNVLLSRSGRYDVVTADLIQPEPAGDGNLYSRDGAED